MPEALIGQRACRLVRRSSVLLKSLLLSSLRSRSRFSICHATATRTIDQRLGALSGVESPKTSGHFFGSSGSLAPPFFPLPLDQPNRASLIQSEDLAGMERRAFFGIGQLFAAPLDAALFDKATGIASGST